MTAIAIDRDLLVKFSLVALLLGASACTAQVDASPVADGADVTSAEQPLTESSAQAARPSPFGALSVVTQFDPEQLQFSEYVTLKDGSAYVSLSLIGQVLQVDSCGTARSYGTVPIAQPFDGSANALTFGPDGSAYVSVGAFSTSVTPGIYRIPPRGGAGVLWASNPAMQFPNGLAFLGDTLLVADSSAAQVFAVNPSGQVRSWLRDPLLAPTANCSNSSPPFLFGASGILVAGPAKVIITNADGGVVVKVPVRRGEAGTPTALLGPDCSILAGVDHPAQHNGDLYVPVSGLNKILRISPSGQVSEIASGGNLDSPSALAFGRFGARVGLLATDFAIAPNPTPTGPALLFAPLR